MDYGQRKEDMLKLRTTFGMTLQEIGDIFGVCRERVRQIVGPTNDDAILARDTRFLDVLLQNLDKTNSELISEFGFTLYTLKRIKNKYSIRNAVSDGNGPTYRGAIAEDKALKKLLEMGLPAKRMQFNAPYDIIVGDVRIDVKSANQRWSPPSVKKKSNGKYYIFNVGKGKKYRNRTDFYLLMILDEDQEDYFIVPSEDIPARRSHIAFAWPLIYQATDSPSRKNWRIYNNYWALLFNKYVELGGEFELDTKNS